MPTKPAPIPVTVISGFLGSGKTTVLNRLLAAHPHAAVVINEFGSTPIDHLLVRERQIPVSTVAGGCLCCQVIGSLAPLLRNLRMAWEAKQHKPFGRVFIETSGVANPEPVLDILSRDRWLAARYQLDGLLATVSLAQAATVLPHYPEAQAQIAWADILVLTHQDQATAGQSQQAGAWLERLAPAKPQLAWPLSAAELALLPTRPELPRPRPTPALPAAPAHPFGSTVLKLTQPIAWPRLQQAAGLLFKTHPQLLRLKGLIYNAQGQALLVQFAPGQNYPPVPLAARSNMDTDGRLVFISDGPPDGLPAALLTALDTGP